MFIFKRVLSCFLLMLLLNFMLLVLFIPNRVIGVVTVIILFVFYFYKIIFPVQSRAADKRTSRLSGGYELMIISIICFTAEVLLYIIIAVFNLEIKTHIRIINIILFAILLFVMLFIGIMRVFIFSGQLGIIPRVLMLFLWWVPVVNILLLKKFIHISGAEYKFTVKKQRRNLDRKNDELCKTRYPLLLVHGIFFRDWEHLNYWGRIPEELINNGATIFYGKQQSAASVEQNAGELLKCIEKIVNEKCCEKVNIIAHSKGGLDSRYAISCLGMDKHVASLTTINTPHYGCRYVGKLIKQLPKKAISVISGGYDSFFTKLGDDAPDFLNGLLNLTDRECARLNDIMKDAPGVLYQSIGSMMHSRGSASFPLDLGYSIMKFYGESDNDGLVTTKSMQWGNFLGVLKPKGKQGISHADVIDLTRKDIEGFDVCELYVGLVSDLKDKGL